MVPITSLLREAYLPMQLFHCLLRLYSGDRAVHAMIFHVQVQGL